MGKNLKVFILFVLVIFVAVAISTKTVAKGVEIESTSSETKSADKLTEVKLKVCQKKEANIQKRNSQLTKLVNNMITKFDSIATRVKTYYTSKAVPAGKTVANYDALVAEIATKKATVQTALDKATTDASAFSCTSDDPKGQLTLYRTDMQAVKQALKDYRTAIKNLIVAIRTATGTTESESDSTINQ